jgi:hypothetical protein
VDGLHDIVTTPGMGSGPIVKTFDEASGEFVKRFLEDRPTET